MADSSDYRLPKWAPRVRKREIERMYLSSAKGMIDEDITDEVGYALYARCQSMLEVTEIVRTSRPKCQECGTILPKRTWEPEEQLDCPNCDWRCPARAYNKTWARKNFSTGGLDKDICEFMSRFEPSKSYGEKLVLIDTLIHQSHWSSDQGRPLVTSLIEGSMKSTMAFLDRLTYGDSVPNEVHRTREEWRRTWSRNGWSKGRGQSTRS